MKKEDPYRDQAERLRQKIERFSEGEKMEVVHKSLPPRQKIHQQKKKRTKWKIKYPTISLIVLFFLLLPVVVFSIYTSIDHIKMIGSKRANSDSNGFEMVDYKKEENIKTPPSPDFVEKKENIDQQNDFESKSPDLDSKSENIEIYDQKNLTPSTGETTGQDETVGIIKEVENQENRNNKMLLHTVKHGETIFRIAMKYYQSQNGIRVIKEANQLSSNEIQTGQVLKIPILQ